MRAVEIEDDVVVNIIVLPPGSTVSTDTIYLPDSKEIAAAGHRQFAAHDTAQIGWRRQFGDLIDPSPTPPPDTASLKRYAADKRWRVETGGIVIGGIAVPTDDRAKVLLMGAASMMADTDTAPYVAGAVAVTLTGIQFKAFYAALTAHVQAAFAAQTAVLGAIDAGTITTFGQIDAAAWPSNG